MESAWQVTAHRISELAKISVTEHATETMLRRLLACPVETFRATEAGVLLLHDPAEERLGLLPRSERPLKMRVALPLTTVPPETDTLPLIRTTLYRLRITADLLPHPRDPTGDRHAAAGGR